MDKIYAVCITDNDSTGEMKCKAKNKTEARATARLYIKQWHLHNAHIDYIKEVEQ